MTDLEHDKSNVICRSHLDVQGRSATPGLECEIALMVDVLNVSTGMNNSTQKKFKQFVLSRKFDAGFGLDLMVKDLGIALGVAEATNTPSPFSSLCRNIWGDAQKVLGHSQDHTVLARFCEMVAGSELADESASPGDHMP